MADANEPLAYETVETPAPAPHKGFDFIQLGFWAALVVAGGAAGMALTWSDAVGPAGAVLVIALGAMALVLLFCRLLRIHQTSHKALFLHICMPMVITRICCTYHAKMKALIRLSWKVTQFSKWR